MKKFLFYLIVFLGLVAILTSVGSLVANESTWWIKILDFPRIQVLFLSVLCLLLFFVLKRVLDKDDMNTGRWIFVLGLFGSIVIQIYYLYPYTGLVDKKLENITSEEAPAESTFDLLVANVYLHNRKVEELLRIIEERDPDMLLLMETNDWWETALQPVDDQYQYGMEYPLDNTYGMILYSRLPLSEEQIKFLNYDSVPSFHALVELPAGEIFQFHGVHPVPPYPGEPNDTGDKEVALVKVGKMVAETDLPAVVAGDFNDVSWARRENLFEQDGLLNDVRIGRGIYSTYSAKSIIKRWPLDYIFATSEFSVVEIARLRDFGSDHFPFYGIMSLTGK